MKTNEELKQIAVDMYTGKIFSDRHLPDGCEMKIDQIFMNIGLAVMGGFTEDQFKEFQKNIETGKIFFMYEYLDKAGPLAVNGYPTFFSCSFLSKEEFDIMIDYYNKVKDSISSL
jgi:hypothetical protein